MSVRHYDQSWKDIQLGLQLKAFEKLRVAGATSCPDCGNKLYFIEAGFLCPVCGYSNETVYLN